MGILKLRSRDAVKTFLLMLLALFLTGCSSHYLTKQMLLEQMFPDAKPGGPSSTTVILPVPGVGAGMFTRYDSNRLAGIICCNQEHKKVVLRVDRNTQLIITDDKGETHKFYLDTVFLQHDDTLIGLRSRILGVQRSVPLDAIDKIEIYSELAKESPLGPPAYVENEVCDEPSNSK
jgi:hypothetical protein